MSCENSLSLRNFSGFEQVDMNSEEFPIEMETLQTYQGPSNTSESSDESDDETREKNGGDIQEHWAVHDNVAQCSHFAGMMIIERFDEDKIKEGERVVRGTDWDKGDEDGGNGNVGTVVKILNDAKEVRVQWDSLDSIESKRNDEDALRKKDEDSSQTYGDDTKGTFTYRTGLDKKYDLRIFDNAQTGAHHRHYECDGCCEKPIAGMRWHCLYCGNYDLCTECYMYDKHNLDHAFERYQGMKTMSVNVGMRADIDYQVANGIFPGAHVVSRNNPNIEGEVVGMEDNIATVYKCDAKVFWEKDHFTERVCVGREGKVDLKFTEPTEMPYIEDHLQEISKENAVVGTRVVMKTDKEKSIVGTITSVKEYKKPVAKRGRRRKIQRQNQRASVSLSQGPTDQTENCHISVQWDDGNTQNFQTDEETALLFDNSQIGIIQGALCPECPSADQRIKGIRWKCSKCPNYNLCTTCYMSGKDTHIDHIFFRITEPQKPRTKLGTARNARELNRRRACGIFQGAKVQHLEDETGQVGTVKEICDHRIHNYRCTVVVDTKNNEKRRGRITDFRCTESKEFCFFPSHLPDLGKDDQGYVKVQDNHSDVMIDVELWHEQSIPKSSAEVQHSLYLIFAHKPDESFGNKSSNEEGGFRPLEDVKKFARKNPVPCQLPAEKILVLREMVVVHKNTTNEDIEKLVKLGVRKFIRGDSHETEDEQEYFLRMSQFLSGKVPLPVFISLRNGVLHSNAVIYAASKYRIPVICFKKKVSDVYVLTMEIIDDPEHKDHLYAHGVEHKLDLKSPWKVNAFCAKDYDIGSQEHDHIDDEITKLSEIAYDLEQLDALVCYLLIGVFMSNKPEARKNIFGINSNVYPNALSMYLMKAGKWKIPKNAITGSYNHQSIEYIFEEKMEKYFKEGLWKELELKTKSAYTAPKWKEGSKNKKIEENDEKTGLNVKISDLFGLIFFALLRKKCYDGAKQLMETGCALRITNGVHEADKKQEHKKIKHEKDAEEIGQINHAGRLLLNHGYLIDAIKTENSQYLNDRIVKNVISQMWYHSESISWRRGLLFFVLTVFHFLLLPVLMITLENRPMQWFYRQYKLPVMKVLLNAFGLVAVLITFAYMLLFDFSDGISTSDCFLIGWMTSYFLDESKQIFISIHRKRFREYTEDWWNQLDWTIMGIYLGGMLLKFGPGEIFLNLSKTILVLDFILMCIRSLNTLMISEIIGSKLVMIKKMLLDTFAFLTIMTLVTGCYCVSYYAILFMENSDFSFAEIQTIIRNGFWIVFGENALDVDNLREPKCSFNKTIYKTGEKDRCPSEWGLVLAPYIKALYAVIAIVLLLNLLIAMYSHTFQKVHEKSKFYWSRLQTDFLEEYSVKTIFPIHFQLLALPVCLVHFILWYPVTVLRSTIHGNWGSTDSSDEIEHEYEDKEHKLNKTPMFVRVFLYDTNFDLKLKETCEAEGQAAQRTSGNLEVTDEDKFTLLQRKLQRQKEVTKLIDERTTKILKEIRHLKHDNKRLYKSLHPDSISEDLNIWDSTHFSYPMEKGRIPRHVLKEMLEHLSDSTSSDDSE